jgi:hypothetical protein
MILVNLVWFNFRILQIGSTSMEDIFQNQKRLHLIVQYFQPKISINYFGLGGQHGEKPLNISIEAQEAAFKARYSEFIQTLLINTKHPSVAKVHVLYEKEEDKEWVETHTEGEKYLTSHIISDEGQMVFYPISTRLTYKQAILYANQKLKGELVVIMHADISIGEGFDYLTRDSIGKEVYALSRYSFNCSKLQDETMCSDSFTGSTLLLINSIS